MQEGRERRVERVRVVGVRQLVGERQRRQHECGDERDGGDRGGLAGPRTHRQADARERALDGRGPSNEIRGRAHPAPRVHDSRLGPR